MSFYPDPRNQAPKVSISQKPKNHPKKLSFNNSNMFSRM